MESAHVCAITGICLRPRIHCEFGIDQAEHFVESCEVLVSNEAARYTERKFAAKRSRRRHAGSHGHALQAQVVQAQVARPVRLSSLAEGGTSNRASRWQPDCKMGKVPNGPSVSQPNNSFLAKHGKNVQKTQGSSSRAAGKSFTSCDIYASMSNHVRQFFRRCDAVDQCGAGP
jgi:hypothetical protein